MVSRLLIIKIIMEDIEFIIPILSVVTIVWAILNTILFFKVWGMCNNIKIIKKIMLENVLRQNYKSDKEVEDLREGDLIFDKKDNLCRIEEIIEDDKLLCIVVKNNKEIILSPKNVDKKLLQFVE